MLPAFGSMTGRVSTALFRTDKARHRRISAGLNTARPDWYLLMCRREQEERVVTSAAIFVYDYSTSGVAYSGGRYHALLMAHAMAHAGADVTVVTNTVPAARADLDDVSAPVRYITTPGYDPAEVADDFDVVVVAPTGGFHPPFYSCAEQVAARCGAALAVLNYESANWFNKYAPTPDHPEVWDYWRRVVVRGGIVLSSTLEADRHARDYYRSDVGALRFEQCYPPLNSVVADRVPHGDKDGSVLYFARPFHDHKGGGDVLALPASAFAGRTLRLVFGGPVDVEFVAALEAKFATVPGASVEVHNRIPDSTKFALLARAGAVLFPSWFEGFGYPPVEAAYLGTESVCYDLPVLRETLGDVATLVPVGEVDALADALDAVLTQPRPGPVLRAAVAGKVRFDLVGERLVAALDPAPGPLTAHPPAGRYTVLWGPWAVEDIDLTTPRPDALDFPPMPSFGAATPAAGSRVAISLTTWSPAPVTGSHLRRGDEVVGADRVTPGERRGTWRRTDCAFTVPADWVGADLAMVVHGADGAPARAREVLRVVEAAPR
ncbi:glycosyltransferase [Saccharothrix sp. S26]|uniref:glycosyltransferase n=1 Tax=Saccharothrix sp. S26 TaxID=2907215 RepID=UPI001F1DCF53|nr:glycosyltransferase [Saccharothrix sp. S26]MCE6995237.1 glycosyltransferase [Saccharothrix sp. S26]